MKRVPKPWGLLAILIFGFLFSYQNCSGPMQNENAQASYNEKLPFAFDTTLDTIAYMSCGGGDPSANPDAIWTIRAGAYQKGNGIKLKSNFMDLTKNFSVSQRAAALSESAQSQGLYLTLAIRQATSLQSPLTSSGSSPTSGQDYGTFLRYLDDPVIAGQLAAQDPINPQRQIYFPGLVGLTDRRMQSTLRFTSDEGKTASVRQFLSATALLTLTYSRNSGTEPVGPAGYSETSAYGTGYKAQFTYGPGETVARVLSSIQELDLETNRPPATAVPWSCPQSLQFRVARSCADCPCGVDNPAHTAILEKTRRVLNIEHWYVNVPSACVVQKSASQQCYASSTVGNHFVSICSR